MTSSAALACPRCKRTLGPDAWADAQHGTCLRCQVDFEFTGFPALHATRTSVAAQPAVLADDSVCFFHLENRAAAICENCGRLLCPVCTVPFAGKKLCPTCIAGTKTAPDSTLVRDRMLFDSLALALAGLPLLIWPLTLVTAPVALGFVIYGWKQPNSLVRGPSRARLIIAAILALLELAGWITVGVVWWARS